MVGRGPRVAGGVGCRGCGRWEVVEDEEGQPRDPVIRHEAVAHDRARHVPCHRLRGERCGAGRLLPRSCCRTPPPALPERLRSGACEGSGEKFES